MFKNWRELTRDCLHGLRYSSLGMIHFFGNVNDSVSAAKGVPGLKISECSNCFGMINLHIAFPIPMIHDVPGPQPLVPGEGLVTNESGWECLRKTKTKQKATKKPVTDKTRLAFRIFGMCRGPTNMGTACGPVSCLPGLNADTLTA